MTSPMFQERNRAVHICKGREPAMAKTSAMRVEPWNPRNFLFRLQHSVAVHRAANVPSQCRRTFCAESQGNVRFRTRVTAANRGAKHPQDEMR